MKVIILAGGWGTRMGELTSLIPKPMIKIGTKPILWHIMKLYSYYGYNEFVICLGVKGEIIKDYFYHYKVNNSDFIINFQNGNVEFINNPDERAWKVTLVNTGLNTLKGGRIKRVEKYLDPDLNMITYGDGLADVNIEKLVDFHKSHQKILTITGVHSPSRFGVLSTKDGLVKSFKEKPKNSNKLINGGFMIFNNKLLNYLTKSENCDFEHGPLEKLVKKEEVMVYKHEGNWACMDHEKDVNYLNKLWENDKAFWKIWN